MPQEYVLEPEEWAELIRLSSITHETPVMALSVADGLAGRDFHSMAREAVMRYWRVLGAKYRFAPETAGPNDDVRRAIFAEPSATRETTV